MPIRFKLQDGTEVSSDLCEPQLNLLAHAQAIELDLGSRCGGHGHCGGDRIRLPLGTLASFSPVRAEEQEHLSEQELAQGYRLACQCFPNVRDLDLLATLPGDGNLADGSTVP